MTTKYVLRVYHAYYGCETGCCGHRIEVTKDGEYVNDLFKFGHPGKDEDLKVWAKETFEDQLSRWAPECLETIDWSTVQVEEATSLDACNF